MLTWQEIGFAFIMLALGLLLECYIDVWRERRREHRNRLYSKYPDSQPYVRGVDWGGKSRDWGGPSGAERARSGGSTGSTMEPLE